MTGKRQKILIVDDKKQNLIALRQVLADMDADIIEAASGNQALAATLEYDFAVAILDVMMPGMDGYELAEHLRGDAKTRRMPIIFLPAVYSEEKRIFKGYEVGAVDYIVKPYNPTFLRSKVAIFLELDRAHAELAEKVFALSASEDRYRSLVTTIPDVVYRIDADGRFTYLNEAVNGLGYTPEELLGSHFSKILLPADVENVSRDSALTLKYKGTVTGPGSAPKLFDERRTGKRKTVGLEVRLVPRKSDRTLPAELHSGGPDVITVEINSSGIYGGKPNGKKRVFLGTVGVIRDITERKQAEEELAKHRDKLENLVRERVKEQACLYGISKVLAEPYKAVDDALHAVMNLIPSGLQYPDIACVRLRLNDRTVTSEPFCENRWRLARDIVIAGKTRGTVEVFYMEERPAAVQGPFLREEKDLVTSNAHLLGQTVNRMETTAREAHLNAVLRSIRNINQIIIHEKRRDRLIQAACENLITSRGFQGAWIVLTDDPSTEDMETACFGFEDAVFAPMAAMLRQGKLPACCRPGQTQFGVVVTDSPAVSCRNCSMVHGYAGNAAMTVRLRHNDRGYGWLGVSVPAEFAADPEEASLLAEIAGDIAFALHNMGIELKQRRYAQIVASSSEAMALVDRGYVYLEANPSYCRLVIGEDTDLAGQRMEDVLGESFFKDIAKPALEQCFAGDEVRFETAVEIPGAVPRFVDALYTPCLAENGTVSAVAVCIRDITKWKCAEEDRKKLQMKLLQSQKMEAIGTLAGGIAHDFNNILTSIIGFTELVLDDVEKGSMIEDNLQEVYTAGKRARDLVQQILAFARQSEENISPVRVDVIAKEVIKFVRSSIPTSIEIKQNIESNSFIMGNATKLHQVLLNLCTNAAQAMENEAGILQVDLKDVAIDSNFEISKVGLKPGDYIEIKISDSGIGIPSNLREFIFEPYFTTKSPEEGTGMGLAVVHGIVEKYGGKIMVNSELGKGSVFTIYLPITKERQVQHPYESEELPVGSERILFLDDEAPIVKMGCQILERLGYSVTTRTNSIEALELFRSRPNDFDLVITDMTMPNMTGDKLAVELMKIRPYIPVILCTGYSKKISDETAEAIGIKAFVYKPIVKADLAKTIRKVLDSGRSKV